MTRFKSWILTDASSDIWSDNLSVSNDSLRLAIPHDWSIHKRTLRGGRRDGVEVVEIHNGALSFTVLPTRGMGLWRGEYRGNFLGWRSPVQGPVHPKFVHPNDRGGLGWLDGFDEWLCRCGLSSNGPPGEDVYKDKQGREVKSQLTLHGKIANLPAHFVEVRIGLDPPFEMSVIGQVEEAALFFPHLRLTTTYTTAPGSNRLVIHDQVENLAAQPAEMQMLYHCNIGPPFLEAGSRIVAPIKEMSPISSRAAEGIDTFDTYAGPVARYAEQVYCYHLLPDAAHHTLAMLYNAKADRALVLRMKDAELPCFTMWKNTGALEDGYVTGLEPAINFPNFKSFERQQGRVRVLPPGGKWEATWSLEILDTAAGVADVLKEIVTLQSKVRPIIHRAPAPAFSSQAT
jgi:Domain of unknown function (DUF4432)